MGVLYVAGQSPGAGATAVCAALATQWQRSGKRVLIHEPLTLDARIPEADLELFARITGQPQGRFKTQPLENRRLDSALGNALSAEVAGLAKEADVVVIHGLPMTDTQGAPVEASAMLAQRLGATVLGVLAYEPEGHGALAETWQEAFGVSLAGLIVNGRTRYAGHLMETEVISAIQQAGTQLLGFVPEDRTMLAPTVLQVADHLQARLLTHPSEHQRLVEQFIIGGLIMEWGGNYFGRFPRQAVIVRGGRIDIAMAALNFPMSCMVLTECSDPSQYVYQRADEQDVPLMAVTQNTMETANALETIDQQVSFHHPSKVERFTELLAGALDWATVNHAAGLQ